MRLCVRLCMLPACRTDDQWVVVPTRAVVPVPPNGPDPCVPKKETPAAMPHLPDDIVNAALATDAKRFLVKFEVVEVNGRQLGNGAATSQPVNDLDSILVLCWFRAACRTRSNACREDSQRAGLSLLRSWGRWPRSSCCPSVPARTGRLC